MKMKPIFRSVITAGAFFSFVAATIPSSRAETGVYSSKETRFGQLITSDYGGTLPPNHLYLAGKASEPSAQGNNHLAISAVYQGNDNKDFAVIKSIGGDGCLSRYSIATVDASGAHPTAFFGTCADAKSTTFDKETDTLTIKMPLIRNHQELKKISTFKIHDGEITRDGTPQPSSCPSTGCQGF